MIRIGGQIVTTEKRTLTKFLGVDKHMIPGDPIRGNDDICNNNYLVLYNVVSDVESDVLDVAILHYCSRPGHVLLLLHMVHIWSLKS